MSGEGRGSWLGARAARATGARAIAVLIAPAKKAAWFGFWKGFVVALWWMVAIIAIAACLDYIIQGVRQFGAARRARVASSAAVMDDENGPRRR